MRINFVILFFVLVGTAQVNARNVYFSLGPELNLPSGNSSNVSPVGVGGFLKTEITLSTQYALTANAGLHAFLGRKMFNVRSQTLISAPVKIGFKYYSSENFYLEGQLGASLPIKGNANTAFAWSPGFGTFLKSRNSHSKLDIGLRYEGWTSSSVLMPAGTSYTTFGFIGLRLGYVFNL